MARLALGVVGAVVGGYFGGAAGAQVGFAIGSTVGGMIDPEEGPTVEGPKIGDKSVSSSAYGAPIAIPYGTVRTSGNMIWSSGIREQRNENSVGGGGKGGGAPSTTSITYTYFASFAMAFGEGEAEDVTRIWADSKLIYDKTGKGQLSAGDISFKFYAGNETQLPDSLIEDDVGAENAPAFRGLTYIVFDDLPLRNFGNRIPSITAEIAFKKEDVFPFQEAVNIGSPVAGFQIDQLVVDPEREYFYLLDATDPDRGLRKYDMRTMTEQFSVLQGDIITVDPAVGGYIGDFVGIDHTGHPHIALSPSNGRPIIKIDPNTLREVGRFGARNASTSMTPWSFGATSHMTPHTVLTLEGSKTFYVYLQLFGKIGVLDEHMNFIAGEPLSLATWPEGLVSDGKDVYALACQDSALYVHKISISPSAGWQPTEGGGWFQWGVSETLIATIRPTDLGGSSSAFSRINPPLLDETDGCLIIGCSGPSADDPHLFKIDTSGNVKWVSDIPSSIVYYSSTVGSTLRSGRYGFYIGPLAYIVDTRDGSWKTQNWIGEDAPSNGAQYYSDRESAIVQIARTDGKIYKFWLDRGLGLGADLSYIVSDVCKRVGMQPSEIDVTELTDNVHGYIVSRQMPARAALTPLSEAFLFDGVESDYVLKFLKRGRQPVMDIQEIEMARVSEDQIMSENRAQEVELPEKFDVVYMAKELDYQTGTQFSKRVVQPKPAMYSENHKSKNFAIVMTSTEALRLSDVLLYQSWVARSSYANALPWRYLTLDPADVITMSCNGDTYRSRVASNGLGVDMRLELESISDDESIYQSDRIGSSAEGFPIQTINNPVPSTLWFLDVPLLRDQDDQGGSASITYMAVGSPRPESWGGAFVYRSENTNNWEEASRALNDVEWGSCMNALEDPSSPWELDTVSSVRVQMVVGELHSCTYEELMNGANACVIDGEVCGFMTAEQDASGYYTLTNWLRAQRGTDYACTGHQNGEIIVKLNPTTIVAETRAIDTLNNTYFYRAVTFGTLMEDSDVLSYASTGKDLKPYSPVDLQVANDGSNNLTVSWTRRTRIAGGLNDGTGDVPLGEAFEKYEVDIFVGGSVVRTKQVTDIAEAVYTTAEQTADGYDIATGQLEVEVFQMSAVIGRGFGRREILEV